MAYTKQTWSCGETITADKLNRMEDGIAEGGGGNITFFPLTYDADNDCHSTTVSYNDVLQAMESGLVYFDETGAEQAGFVARYEATECYVVDGTYTVVMGSVTLVANNATDPLSSCGGFN